MKFVKDGSTEAHLLSLFCSGTLGDFRGNPKIYGSQLEGPLLEKLKLLTLSSLAETARVLPYSQLQGALELGSEGDVESLIIQAIYTNRVEVRFGGVFPFLAFPPSPSLSPSYTTGTIGPARKVLPCQGVCRERRTAE